MTRMFTYPLTNKISLEKLVVLYIQQHCNDITHVASTRNKTDSVIGNSCTK